MGIEQWAVAKHTGIMVNQNQRLAVVNGEVVVEEKIEEREVTRELRVELRASKHSDGYYVAIYHGRHMIAALGLDEHSKYQLRNNGYRFVKADNAAVSFHVFSNRKD